MKIKKITLLLAFILLVNNQCTAQETKARIYQNKWESIGPDGGMIKELILDPSSKNIVYAVAEGGTIFRSLNSGVDWETIITLTEGCTFLAVHPHDSNILFAITGTNGLLKTIDGGKTWSSAGWKDGSGNCIAIDPTNPSIMYLATNKSGGIYKSIDGGYNWVFSFFHEEFNLGIPYVIKIDPQHSNIVYALSMKLYRSTDYGDTWENVLRINGSLTNLDIDPKNSNNVFVSTSEGIYRSIDGGKSFSVSNGGDIDPQHPWTDFVLVNPFDSMLIYRSTNLEAFISTNGGNTWHSTKMLATSFVVPAKNIILSGSRDGVYSANENCENIKFSCKGLRGTIIKSLTTDTFNSNKIFSFIEDQGIAKTYLFTTTTDTVNWKKIMWGQGASEIKIHPSESQLIFGGSDGSKKGFSKSYDGGSSWSTINIDDYIISFAVDLANPSTIYAGGLHGLHRSNDFGETWQKVATPDTSNFLGYSEFKHISIAGDNKTIFVASSYGYDWTYRNALLRTRDNGDTWDECTIRANSVLVFPNEPNLVLCGYSTHIYKSTDYGDTWTIVDPGFTNVSINDFQLINENEVVVATSKGVYYSSNQGDTWSALSKGSDNLNVKCLSLSMKPIPTIFAGTYGRGVYRVIIKSLPSVKNKEYINLCYKLYNNYPNPFNPSTIIGYQLPVDAEVSLKVYDTLGRVVAVLVNEKKTAGGYEVKFTSSGLSSGVYFYRIQTGSFSQTKKFVLLK